MEITLKNIGRRFNRDWIFRNIDYSFKSGSSYAVLGRNGSGKSTLLQIIAGSLTPSEGSVQVTSGGKIIDPDDIYQDLGIATPYMELIEEFTLSEIIDFHFKFKTFAKGLNKRLLLELLDLHGSDHKPLKYFSSGMKQRVKLALAVCSATPVLLLDEPASNFDSQAIVWYQNLISSYSEDRIVIVCSNQENEYIFCKEQLHLSDYK